MAYNVSSDIAAFVQTVYEDALLVARENTLATSLVRVFNNLSGTATRTNSTFGTATIYQIGETDDLTAQAWNPTAGVSLTPSEYGAQFFVTDLRRETEPDYVAADAAQELGMAMADHIDRAVFNNISSLTGGTIGAAGTAITWGYVMAMQALLNAQRAPRPHVLVLHPYQWHVLAKAASIAAGARTNAPEYLLEEVARNYWVTNYGGIDILTTTNLPASSTDRYCALFSRDAMAFDVRRAPRLEAERDASRRGDELNITAVYASGVWRASYGVKGLFDASAPTS